MNFFDDKDAPPIKKPSQSFIVRKETIFELLTEPPYKILGIFLLLILFFIMVLIKENIFFNSSALGIFPEPIAQVGS